MNSFLLAKNKAFIDGEWINAASGRTFAVMNSANGEMIAEVPDMGKEDTVSAVEAADRAFKTWKTTTAKYRAGLLKQWFNLLINHAEDLAQLITLEQGKPYKESYGEVLYGASFIEWFAEEAKRTYGDHIPSSMPSSRYLTIKQPVGVVSAITPFNFPIAMIARKAAPALAAGCTIVIKPSEDTPLCALAMAKLAQQAGIPKGVFNVVTSTSATEVGAVLTTNPLVRKVSFTGSSPIGKQIMRQASDTVKKVSLELGGNAPFIVFDDANIDKAVQGALISKYRNAGQTCVCTNRLYVQNSVYNEFLEKFTRAVATLKIGNGMDEGVDIGPMINTRAMEKTEFIVNLAIEQGATLHFGGKRSDIGSLYYEPTILTNVDEAMDVAHQELFCPVTTVFRFESESDVVARANNTPFGLAAYFYTSDFARVWRVSEALEYGMVAVNEGVLSTEVAPFGGIKESGIGREGSKYGIEDYLEVKYLCLGIGE
ncbi:MAG: NAD-dependent succinate-semialdehyde dehydrogenase [Candidatus Endonucleobacter bathymodioli]|uniref:NAD-dependent succinate-semialdehyde dehydrogenase n=1 Tax=Candidatus Endonucleibacter bathymodioli TaxID=539814 RepID=A0AA90NZD4_9GAMM|nr:NAD-dependent succinate-semialdehyde dehydrogenase [Candidatus Endonucleobacter bathymodioli]